MEFNYKKNKDQTAVLTLSITEEDYEKDISEKLLEYRKKAVIPGFRKGLAPLGLIKKQYRGGLLIEKINQLVHKSIYEYLEKEKIYCLGVPIPSSENRVNPDDKEFNLLFDIGLYPEMELSYKVKSLVKYDIELTEQMLDDQIKQYRGQFAAISQKDVVEDTEDLHVLHGYFTADSNKVEGASFIAIEDIVPALRARLIGEKVGNVIDISGLDLFSDKTSYDRYFGDKENHICKSKTLTFTVDGVQYRKLAELDDTLYQKVFQGSDVKTLEEFQEKIKEHLHGELLVLSDNTFYNDATAKVLEKNNIPVSKDFIIKLIQYNSKEEKTKEEAEKEYESSEQGFKYQILQQLIIKEHEINLTEEELKSEGKKLIQLDLIRYGIPSPDEQLIDSFYKKSLEDKNQKERYYQEVLKKNILKVYLENLKYTEKLLSYDKFLEELKSKK